MLTWPPERQEEAARVLSEMEEHNASDVQLSDEQVVEIGRRLAQAEPKFLSLEEVRAPSSAGSLRLALEPDLK